MKKFKLKLEGVKETLTREQMKKITGGYGTSCTDPENCTGVLWVCGLSDPDLCGPNWHLLYICNTGVNPDSGNCSEITE